MNENFSAKMAKIIVLVIKYPGMHYNQLDRNVGLYF